MRLPIATLAAAFLGATLIGCGGAAIPQPPDGAKAGPPPGPPPGSSPDMFKEKPKKK